MTKLDIIRRLDIERRERAVRAANRAQAALGWPTHPLTARIFRALGNARTDESARRLAALQDCLIVGEW